MASKLLAVADGLVSYLNGETWNLSFVAHRITQPIERREDEQALRVQVWASGETRSQAEGMRRQFDRIYEVTLGISQPSTKDNDFAVTDPLFDLADDIKDALETVRINNYPLVAVESIVPFDPELSEALMFYDSITTFGYREV